MKQQQESSTKRLSSDEIHNRNCWRYLKALKIPVNLFGQGDKEYNSLLDEIRNLEAEYDSNKAYGTLFTRFFKATEKRVGALTALRSTMKEKLQLLGGEASDTLHITHIENSEKQIKEFDDFILSIYENDNHNLEKTYAEFKDVVANQHPHLDTLEHQLAKNSPDPFFIKNNTSPRRQGVGIIGGWNRFQGVVASTFTPQAGTNLPNKLDFAAPEEEPQQLSDSPDQGAKEPKQLRFVTQGQRIKDDSGLYKSFWRVCPVFKLWLSVQQDKPKKEGCKCRHIYFNNLALDRNYKKGLIDIEGRNERNLSKALHELENDYDILVITLPSDKGEMDSRELFTQTTPTQKYQDVMKRFMESIITSSSLDGDFDQKQKVRDFYISPKAEALIFRSQADVMLAKQTNNNGNFDKLEEHDRTYLIYEAKKEVYKKLLNKSFETLGFKDNNNLSPAQQQAVWVQFIKYELPNYIIQQIQPESLNFTCKDAIDRGSVSSAFYNLMRSFESGKPINRDQFDLVLQIPALMAKGRGMNHHINLIWNAVDAYVSNNYATIKQNDRQKWLIEWRDANCPRERVDELFARRLVQAKSEIADGSPARKILDTIEDMNSADVEQRKVKPSFKKMQLTTIDKGILLTALSMTVSLHSDPSPEKIKQFIQVTDQITSPASPYNKLCGLMYQFAGWCFEKRGLAEKARQYYEKGSKLIQGESINQLKESLRALEEEKPKQKESTNEISNTTTPQSGGEGDHDEEKERLIPR